MVTVGARTRSDGLFMEQFLPCCSICSMQIRNSGDGR